MVSEEEISWVLLTCVPQREFLTERALVESGIALDAFVPREVKYPRLTRKRARPNKKAAYKEYPLWGARYVLASFRGAIPYLRLQEIHMVTGIVYDMTRAEPAPALVPGHIVLELHKAANHAIIRLSTPNPHASVSKGEFVSVRGGVFKGQTLRIVDVRGRSALFLFGILGKRHLVEVPLEQCEPSL